MIAIDCRADSGTIRLTRMPGLPDVAFTGDGQMTKHEIRALTLCALAPAAGELLWDVGGGSGTVAIEWMRTHPPLPGSDFRAQRGTCRPDRFERFGARGGAVSPRVR